MHILLVVVCFNYPQIMHNSESKGSSTHSHPVVKPEGTIVPLSRPTADTADHTLPSTFQNIQLLQYDIM